MPKFHGFCSYPHGGYTSLGLFVSCAAALAATCYGVASCRFVVISFVSDQGNFGEYFDEASRATDTVSRYKVGAGLFQWLVPNDPEGEWSDGACVGYQESVRKEISDTVFEAARGFAVFAVLLGFVVTLWCFGMACFGLNRLQRILLSICLFAGTLCAGFTFFFKHSDLCQEAFLERDCQIDEGGMIMAAAVILWFVAFLVSVLFVKQSDLDPSVVPDTNTSKVHPDEMEAARASLDRSKRRHEQRKRAYRQSASTTPSTLRSTPPPPMKKDSSSFGYSFDSTDSWTKQTPRKKPRLLVDDVSNSSQLEVYISDRLNNIERLTV